MRKAIYETERRRKIQEEYNTENGITPTTIIKSIDSTLVTAYEADYFKIPLELDAFDEYSPAKLKETIHNLEGEMRQSARDMKFEQAAEIRDRIKYLKEKQLQV
jgi:excinuclease ABC subunit B